MSHICIHILEELEGMQPLSKTSAWEEILDFSKEGGRKRAVQSSGTKGPAKGAHEGITGRTHSTVNVIHMITEPSNKG